MGASLSVSCKLHGSNRWSQRGIRRLACPARDRLL